MAFCGSGRCLRSRVLTAGFLHRNGQLAPSASTSSGTWRPLHSSVTIPSSSLSSGTAAATALPLSPAVRYLIDTNSLDASLIPASGPHSRLLKGDVLMYMANDRARESKSETLPQKKERAPSSLTTPPSTPSPPPPSTPVSKLPANKVKTTTQVSGYTDIPVSDLQRSNAVSVVHSKMIRPHSSASIVCELRHPENERDKLLLESRIIKAAAATLKQLPHSNVVWNEDTLSLLPDVNVAVRLWSDEGRSLPDPLIITNADRVGVDGIVAMVEERGRGFGDGTLGTGAGTSPALLVSSLISSSLTHYIDVVQSPYSATLSIAGIQSKFEEAEGERGGGRRVSSSVTVSLSSDSRVLNSDLSSQWLEQFKTNLELISSL